MTRVEFFFNVPHLHRQVAVLGEKEIAAGRRIFVLTPDMAATRDLEVALWSHIPTGFLPHCRSRDRYVAETPLVIDWEDANLPHDDILINLQPECPTFFGRFQHLIELVGQDETGREAARNRYRFYRDRGYEIRSIDVAEARA